MTRILFVHAHPDDETLATGIAILHHVRAGDDVHVLTCTLGEEGEVIPPELAHLEGAEGDPLAAHRRHELAGAMSVLGATSHLLGEGTRGEGPAYRDSGMVGSRAFAHPRAFAASDFLEVAELMRAAIVQIAPDVVVTYDAEGGYGHPDHVRVHDAVRAAVADLTFAPRLFFTLTPRSWVVVDRVWLAEHVPSHLPYAVPSPTDPMAPSVVDDVLVTHVVHEPDLVPGQQEALRHHATQVVVGDGWFALSNDIAARLAGREGYALLDPGSGELVPGDGTVSGLLGEPA
jgi:N-acetyl-1-D-myo-inositol-2-amino-2-deoxy-alpha-D-glucopyranoside deacetylase